MSNLIDIDFIKDSPNGEANANRQISGILKVKTTSTIRIEKIIAELQFEVKGKVSARSEVFDSSNILISETIFERGKTYEFPVVLRKNNDIESYKGVNTNFVFSCRFSFYLHESDEAKIDRSFLKGIKSFFTGDKSVKLTKYIEWIDEGRVYAVVPSEGKMTVKRNISFTVMVGLIAGGIAHFLLEEVSFIIIIMIAVLLSGLTVFLQQFVANIIYGNIHAEVKPNDHASFFCRLKGSKHWSVFKTPKVYYEITEEVVDNRGTSSTTYREKIYKSEVYIISNPDHIELQYPEIKNLQSVDIEDNAIIWSLVLQINSFMGTTTRFYYDFEVNKVEGVA